MNGVLIRPMEDGDAGPVLEIYQAGLDTGLASFEVTAPAWQDFDAGKLPAHRHVAVDAGVPDEHERPWWETDPRLTDRFGQA